MNAAAAFGVVIPAFNAERYLERSIASVRAQTLAPARVVVVDDGSVDATAAVAERLGAEVIRQPNGGPGRARNVAAAALDTQWLAFLDADDEWRPNALERYAAAIAACPDVHLVFADYAIDEAGAPVPSWLGVDADYASVTRSVAAPGVVRCDRTALVAALARSMAFVSTSSLAVSRDAFLRAGGFAEELRIAEDLDLLLRLLANSTAAVVEEVLSTYYRHGENLSDDPGTNVEWVLRVLDRVREDPERYAPGAQTTLAKERPNMLRRAGAYALRGGRFGDARGWFVRSWSSGATPAAAGGLTLAAVLDNAAGRLVHGAVRRAWRGARGRT